MYKALIIEDEPLAAGLIERYIQEVPTLMHIGSYINPVQALPLLEEQKPDILFLDIEMPKLNGLDFLKINTSGAKVIIITAFRQYAVESFELEVCDYLVKPVLFQRFLKASQRAMHQLAMERGQMLPTEPKEETHLIIKSDRNLFKLAFSDILYIESLKDYVRIKTNTQSYICHQSMAATEESLPQQDFVRIHRSYIIALNKLEGILESNVLINGNFLPIARDRKKLLLEKFSSLKKESL